MPHKHTRNKKPTARGRRAGVAAATIAVAAQVQGHYLFGGRLYDGLPVVETKTVVPKHQRDLKEDPARGIIKRRFDAHRTASGFTQIHVKTPPEQRQPQPTGIQREWERAVRMKTNWEIVRAVELFFGVRLPGELIKHIRFGPPADKTFLVRDAGGGLSKRTVSYRQAQDPSHLRDDFRSWEGQLVR